jgi:XTP/dITP diphosphohydrolase
MKKILIATTNPGKIEEITHGLKPLIKFGIEFLRLNDVGVEEKVEENGKTFCENAKIKVVFYGEKTKLPTIADDGGLIIPYLNNEPGVKSRRWLGYEASDEELIQYTLKQLNNQPKENRIAFLQTCVCFYHPQTKKIFFQEENIKGWLAEKPSPRRIKGYPFRALFIVEKFNKYYDELTDEEHRQVNHRLRAIKKLIPKIKQSLNLI